MPPRKKQRLGTAGLAEETTTGEHEKSKTADGGPAKRAVRKRKGRLQTLPDIAIEIQLIASTLAA